MLASSISSVRPRIALTQRFMHVLNVPEHTLHEPVTPFLKGVPVNKVRDLKEKEKKWKYWTSSFINVDRSIFPGTFGFTWVPYGQVWVLRSGKVVTTGIHFITPLIDGIKVIKDSKPVVAGVLTDSLPTKNGKSVNAYVVYHYNVKDAQKSATYVDPETKKTDSESSLAQFVRKQLSELVGGIQVNDSYELSADDQNKLSQTLCTVANSKSSEYGIEVISVEVRGFFSSDLNLGDKLVALEVPPRDENSYGAQLSCDYWADELPPPFFEKFQFGGRKEYKTHATNNLIWNIPSPPDFHHFNHVPRITQNPPAPAKKV